MPVISWLAVSVSPVSNSGIRKLGDQIWSLAKARQSLLPYPSATFKASQNSIMWKYIIFLTDSLSRSSCPPSTQFRDYRSGPPHLTNYQFSFDRPYSFYHGWGSGLGVPSITKSPSQAIVRHGFLRHSSPVVLCICSLVYPEFYLFSKEHTRVLFGLTKLTCKIELASTHKSTYNQLAWPR